MRRYITVKSLWWALLLNGVLLLPALGQEATDEEPPTFEQESRRFPAVNLPSHEETLELELMVLRWGESESSNQNFSLMISEQPSFLSRAELSENRVSFDQETWEIPVVVTLQSQELAEPSQGDLKIEIVAEDIAISPPRRELVIPLNSRAASEEEEFASNYDFVLRTTKKEYNRETADDLADWVQQIHDEDIPLYTVDTAYICFTGTEQEVNFGYYRIFGPDGKIFQEGTDSEDRGGIFKKDEDEEAPYEVIIPLNINYYPEGTTEDGDRRMRPPGEYRLEVAVAVPVPSENDIFGIPTNWKPGEWVPVGSFEINEPTFQYQGTATLVFPNENSDKQPYLEVSPVAGGGSNGNVSITAEWDDEHASDETRRWEPVFMAKTATLSYEFPNTINYSTLEDIPDSKNQLEFEVSEYWSANLSSHYGLWIVKPDEELLSHNEDSAYSFQYPQSVSLASSELDRQPGRLTSNQEFQFSRHSSVFGGYPLSRIGMTFGWALRTPDMRFAMSHQVSLNAVIASLGTVHIYGLYRHQPGQTTVVELQDMSRTMERPNRDRNPEDEDGSSDRDRDGSQDDRTGDPQGTLADAGQGSGQGGRGGLGGGQDGISTGNGRDSGIPGSDGTDGSIDPNSIDPNSPDIAGLIATWISIAEPPMNATHGASLRYNDWGVMHGTTHQGRITETPGKPDEVGIRSSPEYLWQEGRDLDSVDHCTLGEFVINSLSGASMAHCIGRYQPLPRFNVPQVVGMTMDQAESRITGESLTPEWVAGPPAPNDRLTGTVVSQFPAQGVEVVEGDPVTLEIYIEPIRLVTLPNLLGKHIDAAEKELESLGLEVVLELGDPAQSAVEQYTVQLQTPPSGEQVDEASIVTLAVFSDYIPDVVMPDLVGQSVTEAEQTLTNLELEVELAVGDPAASAESNNRVQSQNPLPGTVLTPGGLATLTVFSEYVPPPTVRVPSVIGMNMSQLANTLNQAGLTGRWRKGEPAPSQDKAQTVYKQTPAAGTEVLEGSDVIVDMYDDAPVTVVSSDPPPVASSGSGSSTSSSTSTTGGRSPTNPSNLAFLQPVKQIVVPASIQGIGLNTGKATTTRADYKNWLLGDNATHRSYMVAYGRGDPFGNFFEDDTDDTTFFLTMAIWLEQGDTWGSNQSMAPKNQTKVETKSGDEVFLNSDNDAVSFHYSRKGVPAKVILTVAKEKMNTFSGAFRQKYADDIFEQLLGDTRAPASTSASPSTVSQMRLEQVMGDIAKIPLWTDYSPTLRKPQTEWMHPELPVRHTSFRYAKMDKPRTMYDGQVEVEVFWLEKNDKITPQNRSIFEQLTEWQRRKQQAFTPGLPAPPWLQPGPLYFHSTDHMITIKLASNNAFGLFSYDDFEPFTKKLFDQLKPHTQRRADAYTRIQNFRLPSRFQELIGASSIQNWKPRSQSRDWVGGGFPVPGGQNGFGFCRQVSFSYYTGNENRGDTSSGTGLFGIPNGNVQWAKNDNVSFYVYWIERGDPYTPDLARGFIGRDTVETNNKYANIGKTDYIFYSSRVAATVKVYVDNNKGPQRKAGIQTLVNDIFRQLEGHALHPSKIPTSPRLK